jgi:hypothetical protein
VLLAWPTNTSGYAAPIAINKAEAWWIGFDEIEAGDKFSVNGINLSVSSNSWVYIEETDEWLTSTDANPYHAEFVLPSNYSNGTYTVYAHNGTGKEWGWSDAVTLTVGDYSHDWSAGTTYNVTNYGATADDGSDDYDALVSAASAAGTGDTIYFPAGRYHIRRRWLPGGNVRVLGDGATSIITTHSSFQTSDSDRGMISGGMDKGRIESIQLEHGQYLPTRSSLVHAGGCDHTEYINVTFSQREIDFDNALENIFRVTGTPATYLYFSNCTFYVYSNVYTPEAENVHFVDCNFKGIYDCNLMVNTGGKNVQIIDCTASSLNPTDVTDGYGWAKGRFWKFASPHNLYLGGLTTTNMAPRYDPALGKYGQTVDQNSGEQILAEGLYTKFHAAVTGATTNTATLSGLSTDYTGNVIVITDGVGMGQARMITSSSGSTVTLDRNWNVQPTTASKARIGKYGYRMAVYGCNLYGDQRTADPYGYTNGSSPSYTNYTATCGVSSYGGFHELYVASNRIDSVRTALYNWSLAKNLDTGNDNPLYWQPDYFNIYEDNVCTNVLYGITSTASEFGTGEPITFGTDETVMFGNVYRGNLVYVTGRAFAAQSSEDCSDVTTDFQLWEGNVASGYVDEWSIESGVTNQIVGE